MHEIYSNAALVIAWVGKETEGGDTDLAAKTLNTLYSGLDTHPQDTEKNELEAIHDLDWMQKYPWLIQDDGSPKGIPNKYWRAVQTFLDRPYFSRVWVQQEIALAINLVFMSGPSCVSPNALQRFSQWITRLQKGQLAQPHWLSSGLWLRLVMAGPFPLGPLHGIFAAQARLYLQKLRTSKQDLEEGAFRTVISSFVLQASDPRDRIFGLSALTDNLISPDYTRSVKEIYCEFASRYLSHPRGKLDILGYAGDGFRLGNRHELPSWVPDWDSLAKAKNNPQIPSPILMPFDIFQADQNFKTEQGLRPTVLEQSRLVVRGVLFDAIVKVEPRYSIQTEELFRFVKWYAWESSTADELYPTGISKKQALLRTLILDSHAGGDSKVRLDMTTITAQAAFLAIIFCCCVRRPEYTQIQDIKIWLRELGISADDPLEQFLKEVLPLETPIDEKWKEDGPAWELMWSWFPRVAENIVLYTRQYQLFHTSNGYLGFAPGGIAVGDVVCIPRSCEFPVILREKESGFEHVGGCFVLGLMDGEVAELMKRRERRILEQEFEIH